MDPQELIELAKNEPSYQFKRKLNSLVRNDSRFRNLNQKNRQLIMDLIDDYFDEIRNGLGLSGYLIDRKMYSLYQGRLKNGLTPNDLDDIRGILNLFRRD